jgi:hypothetical protein
MRLDRSAEMPYNWFRMKQSDWMTLTSRQQHIMRLAMYVRNAIEDFHVKHLSDTQMKELNPIPFQTSDLGDKEKAA